MPSQGSHVRRTRRFSGVADEKVIEGDADHADTMLSENEGHVRCKRWLADEFVVIGMRANPEPNEVLTSFHCESTMVQPDPCRPKPADFLEM